MSEQHEAGRALDAVIADDGADERVPEPYSTDMAAAWKVVEQMREHPNARFRNLSLTAYCYNRTYATFDAEAFGDYDTEAWAEGNGEYATPLAICLAALKAVSTSTPQGDQP